MLGPCWDRQLDYVTDKPSIASIGVCMAQKLFMDKPAGTKVRVSFYKLTHTAIRIYETVMGERQNTVHSSDTTVHNTHRIDATNDAGGEIPAKCEEYLYGYQEQEGESKRD